MDRLEEFLRKELTQYSTWSYTRLTTALNADPSLVGECVDAGLLPDRCREQEISEWDAWILAKRIDKRLFDRLFTSEKLEVSQEAKLVHLFLDVIVVGGVIERWKSEQRLLRPKIAVAYLKRAQGLTETLIDNNLLPERCRNGHIEVADVREFRRKAAIESGISQGAPYAN